MFGLNCTASRAELEAALSTQQCPFTHRICTKVRKSAPDIKIGTCSVQYQDRCVIICPCRLLEHHQIFVDCLHLLTSHEPGNELYLIPEVKIPGGKVDYFLISAKNKKIRDFCGIELQTMDTIGSLWPQRQQFLHEKGLAVDLTEADKRRSFGMNWKMTLKTILIQMHHKSETFEHLAKHLVLIIQKPLYEHMLSDFNFKDIAGVRLGDPVHIHSYDFAEHDRKLALSLDTRVSTDAAGIAKCLGLNAPGKLELQDLVAMLEQKITAEHRLIIFPT
ncbi:MAG: hypothetical protein IJ228_12215 [Succinivibrio sp.]|nr:hypothetical protein [Succinivibrio sp.]